MTARHSDKIIPNFRLIKFYIKEAYSTGIEGGINFTKPTTGLEPIHAKALVQVVTNRLQILTNADVL